MTHEEFTEHVQHLWMQCVHMLEEKGKQYAKESGDRLEHFFKAADKCGNTPVEALMGMKVKHTVCIDDIVRDVAYGFPIKRRFVDEKFVDEINYLILLHALIEEEGIFKPE